MARTQRASRGAHKKVIDAAIEAFGMYGPRGLSFDDLALQARVTRGTLYRLFGSLEKVFDEAVRQVLSSHLDPAEFMLLIMQNQEKDEAGAALTAVARRWYGSLPRAGARLVMQASLSDPKWRGPEAPIEKLVHILGLWIDRDPKIKRPPKVDGAAAARALLFSLFQLKLSLPEDTPGKQEKEAVEAILRLWQRAVS